MSDCSEKLLSVLEDHGSRLHALLVRLTLREEAAEDLLQELFLKLSRSTAFHRADNAEAYTFQSAIHIAFDWRKKNANHLRIESLTSDPETEFTSPLCALIHGEEIEQVLDTLRKLPEQNRGMVVMRYIQQESYERIAEIYGKSPQQVRGLCHKAVTRLRTLLKRKPSPQRSGKIHSDEF